MHNEVWGCAEILPEFELELKSFQQNKRDISFNIKDKKFTRTNKWLRERKVSKKITVAIILP